MHTEKKGRRTNIRTAVFLIAVIALVAVLSTGIAVFYSNKGIVSVKQLQMDIVVSSGLAVNLDKDAMHFGGITPGGHIRRDIVLSHNNSFPVNARIYLKGEPLANWVIPGENPVYLEPFAANRSVNFTATVPQDAAYGNYSGEITIVFKKA